MNFRKRLWLLVDSALFLLFVLSTRLVYWQLARGDLLSPDAAAQKVSDELKKWARGDQALEDLLKDEGFSQEPDVLPGPVIQRLSDLLATIQRGAIYDRRGQPLALDLLDEQGARYRAYPETSFAPVIGLVSGLDIGLTGLEGAYNSELLGLDRLDTSLKRMIHALIRGDDLVLTVDSQLQHQAMTALDGKVGSITVMDGHTGAILAMASQPSYDPNRAFEPGYLDNLAQDCEGQTGCSGILLNRATQGLYPPGSTFKTVTLIVALDTGQVTPDTIFDFGKARQGPNGPYYVYEVDGGEIPDYNHREAQLKLDMAFAKSANAAFARLGDEMAPETLIAYVQRLGISQPDDNSWSSDFDLAPAILARDLDTLRRDNLLQAATAIGQGELLVSPIQMGTVLLAVLNDGNLPQPYLVESVRDPNGRTIAQQPGAKLLPGIMKPETARIVKDMLVTVVTSGSGGKASLDGLIVGGKTGTAQLGGQAQPHAWFIGFAEDGDRSVVIVVVIENGGEGGLVAAPIFARIAGQALQTSAEPVEAPPTATPTQSIQPQSPTPALPTATPQSEIPGVPPPDILFRPGRVDITEVGSATCPGEHEGPVGSGQFIWPSKYQSLSGGDFKEGHPGIDLSAPSGSAVYAADAGLVIFAGWSGVGYGNVIVIDHGNGYRTLYGHLSQVSQYCGAAVKKGQLLGSSGSTGNSSGPHLHFEVRVPGGYLNPLKVLPTP